MSLFGRNLSNKFDQRSFFPFIMFSIESLSAYPWVDLHYRKTLF